MAKFGIAWFSIILIVGFVCKGSLGTLTIEDMYKPLDVTIHWPQTESGVIPGRDIRYNIALSSSEIQPPCALTPSWAGVPQYGIIATGNHPASRQIRTTQRVYAVTCPSDDETTRKVSRYYYMPIELGITEHLNLKMFKITHQAASSTHTGMWNTMRGIAAVVNTILPRIREYIALRTNLDTVWGVAMRELFQVTLTSPVRPTSTVLDAYNALPSDYPGNEAIFSGFQNRCGTDYVTTVCMGGWYAREYFQNGTGVKYVNVEGDAQDKVNKTEVTQIFSSGGRESVDFTTWSDTLKMAPVPMWYSTRSLTELLDPYKSDPVKYDSFLKGRALEQSYYKFVDDVDELLFNIPKNGSPLQRYVRSNLEKQLTYVKPYFGIVGLLKEELVKNPNFQKFMVTCRTSGRGRDLRFAVITGPCFTFRRRQQCAFVSSNIRDASLMLEFFREPECTGDFALYGTQNGSEIDGKIFQQYRSMRMVKVE